MQKAIDFYKAFAEYTDSEPNSKMPILIPFKRYRKRKNYLSNYVLKMAQLGESYFDGKQINRYTNVSSSNKFKILRLPLN